MADSAVRFNTALAAILTRYSTFGPKSRKSRPSGDAKPPSSRTRIFVLGKASLTRAIRRRRIPTAPAEPGAFPGRNTAATKVLFHLLIKGEKTNHRQVTVAIVVAIEKGELLLAVRGVVGGIQIDGDPTGATMQTLAMSCNDAVRQCFRHAQQFLTIGSIFKTRQGRLRSQVLAADRIPAHQPIRRAHA